MATKIMAQAMEAFLQFHLLKKGKNKRDFGSYSYRDTVFYYQAQPSWRIVKNRSKWVILVRYMGCQIPDWAKEKVSAITVPDLGVFSRFPDDMLADEEVHGRVQYIMLAEAIEQVETIETMNAKVLESYKRGDSHITTMKKRYEDWRKYSKLFNLGWPDMPPVYLRKVTETIHTKIAAYNDPDAVKKRERQLARKEAKKAMGIA